MAIWRWQRSQIPHDVQAGAPRPYTWGTPVAAWDGATCDTRTFIKEQLLTFDVTLCGDWAGIQSVFERSDLSGACYPKYATCGAAVQDPAAFTEAYFEVNYIRGGFLTVYDCVRDGTVADLSSAMRASLRCLSGLRVLPHGLHSSPA